MKIIDTVPYFLENYEPSLDFLRNYHSQYPEIFQEYFSYHCQNTDERLIASIEKYPHHMENIREGHKVIVPVIEAVVDTFRKIYGVHFPIDVNLIIGGFGSNAYTYRQVIPNISFALERLSSEAEHLKVIAAHEFGHAAHNILSDQAGMNWRELKWTSPLTWLIQEGAAIHFSRTIAAGLNPSVYFHFNDEGEEWLAFAESNKEMLKNRFFQDYKKESSSNLFLEWFSIRGGKSFGYDRLGYFLADMFFQDLIQRKGELEAVTAWKEEDFEDQVLSWLEE